jgi:hypothetical protein
MNRRHLLKSSLAATSIATMSSALAADGPEPECYELRAYQLRRGPMLTSFDTFFRDVAIPAWNRAGAGPVGVFDVSVGTGIPSKFVLLTFRSAGALFEARDRFGNDPAVKAAPFTNAPATEPSYLRVESSLLRAFTTIPKLELPAQTAANQPRIFELRSYESHNEKAHEAKVEMFNTGEIAIFRRTGLTPVFFGDTLIGARQPNLTYLLTFPDMAAREKSWDTFRSDPEWKKLSATPGYTDPEIVTNISNTLLKPAPYSQI